jgi:FtsP/CotA-like multicopper oxidase with cupredoxin domain
LNKVKDIFWIAFAIVIFGILIYKTAMNSFTDHFLGDNPQKTKAVIINEKNYMGNQPVDSKFSYSYSFEVNGQQYKGNSHDMSLRVGDTVDVEYNKDHPGVNKPLNPKE